MSIKLGQRVRNAITVLARTLVVGLVLVGALAAVLSGRAEAAWPPWRNDPSEVERAAMQLPPTLWVSYPEAEVDEVGNTVVCSSDRQACGRSSFYWGPTTEIVLAPWHRGRGLTEQHERCHAHQHWSINRGGYLKFHPDDAENGGEVGLLQWKGTDEGQSYVAVTAALPPFFWHQDYTALEDYAEACAYWTTDPAQLLALSLERYTWMRDNWARFNRSTADTPTPTDTPTPRPTPTPPEWVCPITSSKAGSDQRPVTLLWPPWRCGD